MPKESILSISIVSSTKSARDEKITTTAQSDPGVSESKRTLSHSFAITAGSMKIRFLSRQSKISIDAR